MAEAGILLNIQNKKPLMKTIMYVPTILFSVSLAASMLPSLFKRTKKAKTFIPYAIVVSAGFMLSTIFTELIPHLMGVDHGHGHTHGAHSHSSPGLFFAGLSFIVLLAIDVLVLHHSHCDEKSASEGAHAHQDGVIENCTDIIKYSTSRSQALFFMVALSMHSFFEGLGVNLKDRKTSFEICLLVHKIIESFSLGLIMFSAGFSNLFGFMLMLFYSVITPMGVVLRNAFDDIVNKSEMLSNVCNGLALGSIMFIIFVEIIPVVFHGHKAKKLNVGLLLTGYCAPPLVELVIKKLKS